MCSHEDMIFILLLRAKRSLVKKIFSALKVPEHGKNTTKQTSMKKLPKFTTKLPETKKDNPLIQSTAEATYARVKAAMDHNSRMFLCISNNVKID